MGVSTYAGRATGLGITGEMSNDTCQLLAAIHAQVVRIADATCRNQPVIIPHQAYTRTQAARLIGVSTWTIDKGRKEGVLTETRRLGQRDVRVTGDSLLKLRKSREAAPVRVRQL